MNNIIEVLHSHLPYKEKICTLYEKFHIVNNLTYEDILNNSKVVAGNLQAMGLDPKSNILISLETSQEFIYSFFGVIMAGHIPVPITSKTLIMQNDFASLISKIQNKTAAKFMISKEKLKGIKVLDPIDLIQLKLNLYKNIQIEETETCFIQFSSGSTQDPKGCVVTHKNLMTNLKQIKAGMQVTSNDRICSWLPLHHDMGLVGVLISSLFCRVKSYLMPPIDFMMSPKNWLQLVADNQVSVIVAPNAGYSACIKKISAQQVKDLDLSSLRLALSGAEPVNFKICQDFLNHFKESKVKQNIMFPVYGLAEATLAVTFNDVGQNLKSIKVDYENLIKNQKVTFETDHSVDFVSCGKPLKNMQLEIRKDKKACSENEVGEIHIKGENIVNHYLGQKNHLKENWLATGDLGFISDGLLYIVGRIKDLIIVNGKNIAANDIEHRVSHLDSIKAGKVVAFGHIDDKCNEVVKVVAEVCVTNKTMRAKIKKDICNILRTSIVISKDDIFLVPPLFIKKTTSGKVKRFFVKERFLDGSIQKLEKHFYLYFIRSQLIINLLKIKFSTEQEIKSVMKTKTHAKKEVLPHEA